MRSCAGSGTFVDHFECYLKTLNTWRVSFLVIKIILGVHLLTYATRRRAGMEAREQADRVNDFGRDPIGEGKEEQVRLSALWSPWDSLVICFLAEVQQGTQDLA